MPDRDFYLQTDPKSVETREKYLGHARRMFELLGHTPERAKAEADAVLQIETALAQVALDRVSLRDPNKRYHKVPVAELGKLTPDFDWKSYLTDLGVSVSSLNVGMPDFMKGLEATLTSASLDDLKTYPTWHVLRATAPMLPKRFSDESFAFFGKTLTGAKEEPARWKRCVLATDRDLGEIVGQK